MSNPDLDAPLTPGELESLRELSKGLMRRVIPEADTQKLISIGYARGAHGGTMITDAGKLRLMKSGIRPFG